MAERCGLGRSVGGAAGDRVKEPRDPVQPENDRGRRDLPVRQLHRLLLGIAQVVDRSGARQDVDDHAQRDFERELARLPEIVKLLSLDELGEDDEVVAASDDVTNPREVRAGERRDAARLAEQLLARGVARVGGALESLRNRELRLAAGTGHGIPDDVYGVRARPDLAHDFARREGAPRGRR
jgi:hypothetical protein